MPDHNDIKSRWAIAAVGYAAVTVAGLWQVPASRALAADPSAGVKPGTVSLELNDQQATAIKIAPVTERSFIIEIRSVGAVDFNEDLTVPVFPPYPGKIVDTLLTLGDPVRKGQPLYTISSPDLIQAEATLIGAAAMLDLTNRALERAKLLYDGKDPDGQALAQKDYEQAVSDQQSAEGALKAARDAVEVFGKTAVEIDRIVARRSIDPLLVVPSPIAGRITARSAQPGLFVQPGNDPAPYIIADMSTVWLMANIAESDSPRVKLGQVVKAEVLAYPHRVFEGTVAKLGAVVDSTVHTLSARSEIRDPEHLLRPGMIASFTIEVDTPQRTVSLPVNGLVREGDGTMTAWVTTDRHHFTQRVVKVGLQRAGYWQVTDGLKAGELIVSDGAILLDNMAAGGAPD